MSSISVAGDVSGAISIAAPSAAGSGVLTLPTGTDTLVGKATTDTLTNKTLTSPTITGATITVAATAAPAFSVYLAAAQNITASTWTKITFNTKVFDTNTNFDAATNYRFTPTVAGYYQINGAYAANSTAANPNIVGIAIYKNGSVYNYLYISGSVTSLVTPSVSSIINFNGTTDYIEFYAYLVGGTGTLKADGGSTYSYISGSMIRSA